MLKNRLFFLVLLRNVEFLTTDIQPRQKQVFPIRLRQGIYTNRSNKPKRIITNRI